LASRFAGLRRVRQGLTPLVVLFFVALAGAASLGFPALAQSLEQQIDSALKPAPRPDQQPGVTRGLGVTRGFSDTKSDDEHRFIDRLRSRAIAVEPTQPEAAEDRHKIAEMIMGKPQIDLEIYFDYDSAVVGPKALPALVALGNVLSKPDYRSAVFFINGFTDARGGADYNLRLSQRRAEAVKRVLIEQFGLPPDTLISTGFGKELLKFPEQPFADQNRRVQIVNTEQKASAGR
jgi:outer membrane protein OmpA-like peptidoglycan-associated protein